MNRLSPEDWFDREQTLLDEDLDNGHISLEEHRRFSKEIMDEYKDMIEAERNGWNT